MKIRHPIDDAIRERVRALDLKQKDLAKKIGRSPAWVSKYLSGVGHATIDDLVRISAIAQHLEGLSDLERRLLHVWKRLPKESQTDAVRWFEDWTRRERRVRKRG